MNIGDIYISADPFSDTKVKVLDAQRGRGSKGMYFYIKYEYVYDGVIHSCTESEFMSKYVLHTPGDKT